MKKTKFHITIFIILICLVFSFSISSADPLISSSPSEEPTPTVTPSPTPTATPLQTIKLSFAGDVMFDKKIENIINKNGLSYVFSEVRSIFASSEVSMVNLETPISKRGTQESDKQFTFRANPDILKNFTKSTGINFVSLANNHILDFGSLALDDTLSFLKKEKINRAGAGENLSSASKPTYIETKGYKIAIIASSRVIPFGTWHAGKNKPGVASTYNTDVIKQQINDARKTADIVVVYVHWGNERIEYPIKVQKDLARLYIDNGADMVIGSHPHVLEGLEIYKNKIIAYSLGNFVFTDLKKDTMVLDIRIENKKIRSARIIPCEIRYFRPVLIKDKTRFTEFINKMNKLSYNVRIDGQGNILFL